jgi:hypothetical protein
MRKRRDPAAWRNTPDGDAKYRAARDEAQRKANEFGYDYGLEANDLFKSFHVFMLPSAANRFGHELLCEVVHPMTSTKQGHGHAETSAAIRKAFNTF